MAPTPFDFCTLPTAYLTWRDVLDYTVGLQVGHRYNSAPFRFRTPGFIQDIYTFYHRGRYGWAPRDTWNLHNYYDQVIGDSLEYFADHLHGAPAGYPHNGTTHPDGFKDMDTDFAAWESDLRRWSQAFKTVGKDDYYELYGENYHAWTDEENARRKTRNDALREMIDWWDGLWD